MIQINLDEVHHIQLDMMDKIHSYCVENNIRYSLAGGSLLGAIKHRGYVPYDDDIDIMMPRPDYERFVKAYHSDTDYVMDMRKSDSCRESFSKVCREGTRLIDPVLGRSTFPIFIDVCPVDGAPEDFGPYFSILNVKLEKVPKLCAFYKEVPDHKVKWFLKYVLKRLFAFYFKSTVKYKEEIHQMLESYPFDTSPKAGELLVCRTKDDIYNSQIFRDYVEYEFEGRKYMGIRDSAVYLKQKYAYLGDYLNLPKLSKPVHDYAAYISVVND